MIDNMPSGGRPKKSATLGAAKRARQLLSRRPPAENPLAAFTLDEFGLPVVLSWLTETPEDRQRREAKARELAADAVRRLIVASRHTGADYVTRLMEDGMKALRRAKRPSDPTGHHPDADRAILAEYDHRARLMPEAVRQLPNWLAHDIAAGETARTNRIRVALGKSGPARQEATIERHIRRLIRKREQDAATQELLARHRRMHANLMRSLGFDK
jgi:hypothetical protein